MEKKDIQYDCSRGCIVQHTEMGELFVNYHQGCCKLDAFSWMDSIPTSQGRNLFEVRFKNTRKMVFRNESGQIIKKGDLVIVEAANGHDLGIVTLEGPMVLHQLARHNINPATYEFRKIYRQNDPRFIELLEHIRTGNMTHADLVRINSRVVPEGERNSKSVTLTARRDDARAINESRLNTLEGELHTFDVTLEGDCKRVGEIAEEHLMLKEGAQVMFTKNDKDGKWVNGTVGTVKGFSDVHVRVALEDGTEYHVERETWEFTDYEYDKETQTYYEIHPGNVKKVAVVGAVEEKPDCCK